MASGAYEYSLNLLSARAYTTRNLRRKLVLKKFDAGDVAAAVDRLEAAGLLDDGKFAREYARQRLTSGRSSVRRVQQDLIRKGVSSDAIRTAIERVVDEENVDLSGAVDLAAQKKLASMGDLPVEIKKRRLFAFLARRGFEIADIRRVTASLISGVKDQ